jgi:hypothetical protein
MPYKLHTEATSVHVPYLREKWCCKKNEKILAYILGRCSSKEQTIIHTIA